MDGLKYNIAKLEEGSQWRLILPADGHPAPQEFTKDEAVEELKRRVIDGEKVRLLLPIPFEVNVQLEPASSQPSYLTCHCGKGLIGRPLMCPEHGENWMTRKEAKV